LISTTVYTPLSLSSIVEWQSARIVPTTALPSIHDKQSSNIFHRQVMQIRLSNITLDLLNIKYLNIDKIMN